MDSRKQQAFKKQEGSFTRYNASLQGYSSIAQNRSDQDSFEKDEILGVNKVLYPIPMHPSIQQNSEKIDDLFIHNDKLNRDMQPYGMQPQMSSNISFGGNMLQPSFQMQFSNTMMGSQLDNIFLPKPTLNMASQINMQFQNQKCSSIPPSVQITSMPISHIIKDGMRVVCEIDLLLLKRFYSVRNQVHTTIIKQVFAAANQKLQRSNDMNISYAEWLKQRFTYHFQPPISQFLNDVVDRIEGMKANKQEEDEYGARERITPNHDALIRLSVECPDIDQMAVKEVVNQIQTMIEQFLNRQ